MGSSKVNAARAWPLSSVRRGNFHVVDERGLDPVLLDHREPQGPDRNVQVIVSDLEDMVVRGVQPVRQALIKVLQGTFERGFTGPSA
jgi:hypothetical protein